MVAHLHNGPGIHHHLASYVGGQHLQRSPHLRLGVKQSVENVAGGVEGVVTVSPVEEYVAEDEARGAALVALAQVVRQGVVLQRHHHLVQVHHCRVSKVVHHIGTVHTVVELSHDSGVVDILHMRLDIPLEDIGQANPLVVLQHSKHLLAGLYVVEVEVGCTLQAVHLHELHQPQHIRVVLVEGTHAHGDRGSRSSKHVGHVAGIAVEIHQKRG